MMLMDGNNYLGLNQSTLNKIISDWFNRHSLKDEGKVMKLEFSSIDGSVFRFQVSVENGNEDA